MPLGFRYQTWLVCVYVIPLPSASLLLFFFFKDTATTEIYTLSLHDALPIYTGEDLAAAGLGTMGVPFQRKRPDGSPMFWRAHRGLAEGRVRHVGEPVAFVVAESPAQARDAAELVEIDYEILPSVTDTAEAAAGKHPVWDECPDNISNLFESGNKAATEAAFAGAAQIVKRRYAISRVYAHCMEPRGA